MTIYRHGDILATPYRGTTRYVRVYSAESAPGNYVSVTDCDAAGFHLDNGRIRYLQTRTLDTRYRLHFRPDTKDQS